MLRAIKRMSVRARRRFERSLRGFAASRVAYVQLVLRICCAIENDHEQTEHLPPYSLAQRGSPSPDDGNVLVSKSGWDLIRKHWPRARL